MYIYIYRERERKRLHYIILSAASEGEHPCFAGFIIVIILYPIIFALLYSTMTLYYIMTNLGFIFYISYQIMILCSILAILFYPLFYPRYSIFALFYSNYDIIFYPPRASTPASPASRTCSRRR